MVVQNILRGVWMKRFLCYDDVVTTLNTIRRSTSLLLGAALLAAPVFAGRAARPACHLTLCCPVVSSETGLMPPSAGTSDEEMAPMQSNHMSMSSASTPAFLGEILNHATAGTSAVPDSTPQEMLMTHRGAWSLMFHGTAFLNATQQSGPRGSDKIFSTNWLMPMAQRPLGSGTFTARAMFSLEPATISGERYPELFQTGETAYGNPIVDGQHPHNFIMELALLYDARLGENTLLSLYAAPVGDPAMGPEGFPHRPSASEDPLAPLGHHLQDSTHISDDVITAGFAYKIARIEFSGFHGREPDEFRWDIDSGAVDSWSARLTLNPAPNWSGQFSIARLKSPEELFPNEDTLRMTASVSYNRSIARGNWASMILWGRNLALPGGEVLNSYLAESTLRFWDRNNAWTRIENVDRTNLLLLGENPLPPGFAEHFLARVQAYTFGYDREFDFIPRVSTAFGGQFTSYSAPSSLDAIYGAHPAGMLLFIRFRAIPLRK